MRSLIVCTFHQILLVIKSRSLKWAGHVACIREMTNTNILDGKPKIKNPLGGTNHRYLTSFRIIHFCVQYIDIKASVE
jgi:hypothetical protein